MTDTTTTDPAKAAASKDRRPTAGAIALKAWLVGNSISLTRFCTVHSLDRIGLQKAVNGDIHRISVNLAFAIEVATQGAVKTQLWASDSTVDA